MNEILRCKPGAIVIFAPVCKSFSRMSDAYEKRWSVSNPVFHAP